jgi:hypothetical protein
MKILLVVLQLLRVGRHAEANELPSYVSFL